MSLYKCTMFFNYASNIGGPAVVSRTAGWSESHYCDFLTFPDVQAGFEILCRARAPMLPNGTAVVYQRYQAVDPVGPSRIVSRRFPGPSGAEADIPQMALEIRCHAADTPNSATFKLKGLPDEQVSRGEYWPTPSFASAVQVFSTTLITLGFATHGRDLDNPKVPIHTITASGSIGTVDLEEVVPFTVGQFVRVLRTTQADGRQIGGRFRVASVTFPYTLTLANWSAGNTERGSLRLDGEVWPPIGSVTIGDAVTAKVGRPFGSFRGRQSKRR